MITVHRRFRCVCAIACLIAITSGARAEGDSVEVSSDKPFSRAIVFSGESINTALFLGMLDAVIDAGKTVDVIIASCGGAIAAAIVSAVPERRERLPLLKSREFYGFLRGLELYDIGLPEFLSRAGKIKRTAKRIEKTRRKMLTPSGAGQTASRPVPDAYGFSLATFDVATIPLPLDKSMDSGTLPIVVVASRLEFDEDDVGESWPFAAPLFTEVFFTDPDTASMLSGLPSFAGTIYPLSAVSTDTDVVTGVALVPALRASIANPLMLTPVLIDGRYYMTGAINIDPNNVARHLADEVIARYPPPWGGFIDKPLLMVTFGFDSDEVRRAVLGTDVDHWIDMSDTAYPKLGPGAAFNATINPGRMIALRSRVPEQFEEYRQIVDAQYALGYARGKEAVANRGTRSHIRRPFR